MIPRIFRTQRSFGFAVAGLLVTAGILSMLFLRSADVLSLQNGSWRQQTNGVWEAVGTPPDKPVAVQQQEFLVREAQLAYNVIRGGGADLSAGPCLGPIFNDWVADVVHDPRTPEDDLPANQCPEIAAGTAHHFIELDPNGALISAH